MQLTATLRRATCLSLGALFCFFISNQIHAQQLKSDPVHSDWPELIYATYWGGSDDDEAENMVVDDLGNIIIAGQTKSDDLPVTAGAFQTVHAGQRDIFVAKFAPDHTLLWATYLGGDSSDYAYGLAVDSDGSIYISGSSKSLNFPVLNAFQSTLNAKYDGVVAKFSASGALMWSTYFGGNEDEDVRGIALDEDGRVYVTGETESDDLHVTPGAFQTAFTGDNLCFITRFSTNGDVVWSTYFGGDDEENGNDLYVDGEQNVIVIGEAYSVDCPLSTGFYQDSIAGNDDALMVKLDSLGNVIFATVIGGTDDDDGRKVGFDMDDNIYIIGDQTSIDLPTTAGAFQDMNGGGHDAFVMKFTNDGQLIWSSYLGGPGDEFVYGIDVDHNGTVYVLGETDSTDFPVTAQNMQDSLSFPGDMFITTFDSLGNVIWSTYFGGDDDDDAAELRFVDHDLFIVGTTESSDIQITQDAWQNVNAGDEDVYYAVFEYEQLGTTVQDIETVPLTIFPQPADEMVVIRFEDGQQWKDLEFKVFDVTGALVLFEQDPGNTVSYTLSTKALTSGIYLLEITAQDQRIAGRKLVIE